MSEGRSGSEAAGAGGRASGGTRQVIGITVIFAVSAAIKGTRFAPFRFSLWYGVLPAELTMLVTGPMEEFSWSGLALPLQRRLPRPLGGPHLGGALGDVAPAGVSPERRPGASDHSAGL